jgi:UDP-N-acetylmuramate: L-alanyl-gamma-D-glutamyl-meso-diaminopimelate ligase
MKNNLPRKIHFVGICGVATGALAVAMKNAGVEVTGSDKGFYPPISNELKKHGILFYAGWHPEKMMSNGKPEVIIVGTASGSKNPETMFAVENGIKVYSFAEAVGEFLTKKQSIVCTGTWGKTSSSALLAFIFEKNGFSPSYMFGGISLSLDASAKIGQGDISILEGDEYKSSPTDKTAKFFYYKPTHLLLSAVSWDHADLYPTEEAYFKTFEKLLASIPKNGFVVAKASHPGVSSIIKNYKGKLISYGEDNADYIFHSIRQDKQGTSFLIEHKRELFEIVSPMIGDFQAENITGVFAMAKEFGIPIDNIISSIKDFRGVKRRLEKRLDGDIVVFDDIAHSPEKAASVLRNIKKIYNGRVFVVFEPNIGSRQKEISYKYNSSFELADFILIPRLTKLKTSDELTGMMEGDDIAKAINKDKRDVMYIEEDEKLVEYLVKNVKKKDVIVFMGAHGFRGMIEETVQKLSK